MGGASRNGAAGGLKARDHLVKDDVGGNEYAQPIAPVNLEKSNRPTKNNKHRERRKQMSMQQG